MNKELLNQPVTALGPIGAELEKHRRALLALWPSETPSVRPEVRPDGMRLHAKHAAPGTPQLLKALFVRTIGLDAMWVSRPFGFDQSTYWALGDADTSEHFFCLKPFELQNRYWWDEVGSQGIVNLKYGIDETNVDEVTGPTETVGTGTYTAPTSRRLFGTDTQIVDPPIATNEGTTYVGTTVIIGTRIPKGLLVCNEKGKVVWDAFDMFSIGDKPETLPAVLTWAYNDPDGPNGFTSPPKPGNYDVEFIDMNTDGRHWKTQPAA